MEAKINRWDYIKLKSICTAKEVSGTLKGQPMKWENIFPNHVSDKELISKIYKKLTDSTGRKGRRRQSD